MILIDCHAHIYPSPSIPSTIIPTLLSTAHASGVRAILNVSESPTDALAILHLASLHPILNPCIGLHPVCPMTHASVTLDDLQPTLDLIRANRDRIVAIGECGLDFSPHVLATTTTDVSIEDQKEVQRTVFRAQISMARELGLPLNVHSRNAGRHAVDEVVRHGGGQVRALFHCFDGRTVHALRAVEDGHSLSVPAHVERNDHMRRLVRAVPIEALVLETDSPALSPNKDDVNEPANVVVACRAVADIKGLTVQDMPDTESLVGPTIFKMHKSPITTHVLDTTHGIAGAGVDVTLELCNPSQPTASPNSAPVWEHLANGVTDKDGRCSYLLSGTDTAAHVLRSGIYRLTFGSGAYFAAKGIKGFFPYIYVVFEIPADANPHYHIPVLLSPYSYSTYRGT
ncbi:putative deoxyribonuclease tatdn3 [Thoreauomyces humboldtii]|nr:putative deoxyribonuclease tatdn3 [Thoreauomyces humboldtii]